MKRLKHHDASKRVERRKTRRATTGPDGDTTSARKAHGGLDVGERHRGQARIAYRFARAYKDRLIYVRGLGWHVWDGTRWAADTLSRSSELVLEVVRAALDDDQVDERLRSDARKCESAAGIKGVLEIASTLAAMRVPVELLDADPDLLNVANGTLDLRSGRLRPHNPADLITRVCAGAYRPKAAAGVWDTFLRTVLPNSSMREYFQRVIGQSVYGDVREHLFPILTGSGANGKSTAYGAINYAMGDYSINIDPSMLISRSRGPGGPETMDLLGARLVFGSETDDGKRLNTALMKRLTGGDSITARNLFQPTVTWEPTHQLVYITNHLPKVDGRDPAVWRRVRVIPFDVVVPERKRDPELPTKLKEAADEVLTWAVQGWIDYRRRGGMDEPETVTLATDQYRTESDPVKRFVRDRCNVGERCTARTRELYDAWIEWAEAEGAEMLSETAFAGELDRLGFIGRRTKTGKLRTGIGLLTERA